MNKLLSTERKWLSLMIFIEIIGLIVLFVISFFFPDFPYYFYIALGLTGLYIIVDFLFITSFNLRLMHNKGQSELKAASIIGNDINEAYNFGELGLAVCDHDNFVIWTNDFMTSRFNELIDQNIFKKFPQLERLKDAKHSKNKDCPRVNYENRIYEVELIEEARLFIFKDITDFANVYNYNKNQSPVVGYLAIDNYNDVQMYIGDDTEFTEMQSGVNEMITQYASDNNMLMRKLKEDRYLFVTTRENYEKIYQEKFSLVDDVTKKYPRGFTLSIGIALGFPDYAKLASMASSALDVALSRGGDQVVVDNHGQPLAYFGGKTDLMPSRNRVKTRTLSNSFLTILRNYRNVVIMGHKTADFDAIASSLAVYSLCQYVGVDARICYEEQLVESKCRNAIAVKFEKSEFNKIFVSMRELDTLIHDKTLLVMVDHGNPDISIFSEYGKKFDNIAVIDHHRPGAHVVNNPVFEDIDTSASSASEILTSFIMYNPENIEIDERTATFLLAGICLDTHFYREHATNSTFEASAQLKNWNANTAEVTDFLKEDLSEYQQKISILNTAETPYSDIYVMTSPDNENNVSEVTLSRVADEALMIRDIHATFCIGRVNSHTVRISARSDSSVNVAILMEKMGGGGRFASAACECKDVHVEEVKEKLLAVLRDYLEDARINYSDAKN